MVGMMEYYTDVLQMIIIMELPILPALIRSSHVDGDSRAVACEVNTYTTRSFPNSLYLSLQHYYDVMKSFTMSSISRLF